MAMHRYHTCMQISCVHVNVLIHAWYVSYGYACVSIRSHAHKNLLTYLDEHAYMHASMHACTASWRMCCPQLHGFSKDMRAEVLDPCTQSEQLNHTFMRLLSLPRAVDRRRTSSAADYRFPTPAFSLVAYASPIRVHAGCTETARAR